ncbi:putative receptor protein kinase ZmPK1 [Eucalyptus grandis]|uniref:putative receptor protein kinase ZmPK1 n=1 Tax=Eucalyptus grandis TaxID=71139 RepID=UPI00192EA9B2|nr:putative receptor protein kinase ZmPK1 [Eucalyptus grandis]
MNHKTITISSFSLFTLMIFSTCFTFANSNVLHRGSSLSVEEHDLDTLTSPDKTFTCGFYGLGGNAYWLSIWFTNPLDRTVVWTANRDKPVNGQGSKFTLQGTGLLILTNVDGYVVWQTNTTSTDARSLELLNSGNLVLRSPDRTILWQSFDYPTDTLLPNQLLTKSKKLVSSLKGGAFYSGYFNLYFDNDNVLRLMYDELDISSLYWPNPDFTVFQNGRTNYNSSRIAVLDDTGHFQSSDQFQFNASDRGLGIKRRLTMDQDGNLRLFSLDKQSGSWVVTWQALPRLCNVHGICGRNGICVYTPEPKCTCPPGYEMSEPTDWNKGCKPKFNFTCSKSQDVKFLALPNTDYYGFDAIYNDNASFNFCMQACLDDCSCLGFSYRESQRFCFGKRSLFSGYKQLSFPRTLHLKLPISMVASLEQIRNGSNPDCSKARDQLMVSSSTMYDTISKRVRWAYLYWFASAIGAVEILIFFSGWWILFRKGDVQSTLEDGYRAITSQFRRFSYEELKSATQNFKGEIGRGASGSVYKGVLADQRVVAEKRLGDVNHEEEVFWAEVSTIGKIHHMNLVRMWGFCCEGKHKLLVYEYVENQSLDKNLFSGDYIEWRDRLKIALGTAKGLAYLHHECLEWVIHCDVKPENILLDKTFEPKIADFGLAKLLQRAGANSEFSRIRGTKGYMAPEWALNLPITAKVDVYSYGLMVLEIVKEIRLSSWVVKKEENEEQEAELTVFTREIKRRIQRGEDLGIEDLVDKRLKGKYSRKQARMLVEIGMSCVEEDRNKRPTMDSIVINCWKSMAKVNCQSQIMKIKIDFSIFLLFVRCKRLCHLSVMQEI